MATKPAKPAAADAEASPAKPKGKRMVLAAVGLVVLAAAGGGGWYFFKGSHPAEEPKAVVAEPTFMVLEPFTVNLQHEEGEQFLQIGITFKVARPDMADKARQHLPEIRSRLLFLLSAKRASDLMPIEGKQKLAQEILTATNAIIDQRGAGAASGAEPSSGGAGITDVLFTSFIIQ
jgi:flagellar FliL protein